ncbi:hypothetical protein T4D_8755 [Trichinella pseudospiralis]|uniref:Uncharacterized protein n=1 Tax=Trichinella pseudospiralis TaxID=6337 RepID=A0A0V1FFB7_TRIPS|nr:hypothetical protein T4D_8755 [Trichinella pseudospiralis]
MDDEWESVQLRDKSHVDMCIRCTAPRSMRAMPLVALRPKAAAALVNTGFC